MGYENIGPRGYNRDLAIAQVIDKSIQRAWAGAKSTYRVEVAPALTRQTGAAGSTVTYEVQVFNTGAMTDTFTIAVNGNLWPTRILSGGVELKAGLEVLPCNERELSLEVDVPITANVGDEDTATITASSNANVNTLGVAYAAGKLFAVNG